MFGWFPPIAQVIIQQSDAPSWLQGMPWYAWVGIVGLVVGGINGLAGSLLRHRERMAMIQQGMHPDAPPTTDPAAKPVCREASEF